MFCFSFRDDHGHHPSAIIYPSNIPGLYAMLIIFVCSQPYSISRGLFLVSAVVHTILVSAIISPSIKRLTAVTQPTFPSVISHITLLVHSRRHRCPTSLKLKQRQTSLIHPVPSSAKIHLSRVSLAS